MVDETEDLKQSADDPAVPVGSLVIKMGRPGQVPARSRGHRPTKGIL